MMMTTEDSLQYDESYGAYEEEGYDESAYYQEGGEGAGAGAGAGMFTSSTTGREYLLV